MFTVTEIIDSYDERKLSRGTDAWEEIEEDDMDISRLVVESIVSGEMRERMQVRYDHHTEFLDFPGGFLFMMALYIFNASVSFDIEGAQEKFEELTLDNYPGEDVSAFIDDAHKHVKVMQSGYALPIRVGYKLLMKVANMECEYFNRKIFAILDCEKEMEDTYRLSDPAPLTSYPQYNTHGSIALIT
jgi:hypothetical protein